MVKYLDDYEKLNIVELYEETFHDDEEYCKFFYDRVIPKSEILVDMDETKKINSMITVIPKDVTLYKNNAKAVYLYGVATKSELRKKGIMSELLRRCIVDCSNKENVFVYLIPDSNENADYYKKFGFEYVMDRKIGKREEKIKKPSHTILQRHANKTDAVRLSIFAQNNLKNNYGVFLTRTKEYYEYMCDFIKVEQGSIEILSKDKIILGYRILVEDDIFEEIMEESIRQYSVLDSKTEPYAMARIANVSKFMEYVSTKETGRVVIKLKDELIKENNGTFAWNFSASSKRWAKTDKIPDIEINIADFTAYLLGYKKYKNLPELNIGAGFYINDYL